MLKFFAIFGIWLFFCCGYKGYAQDPQFSQYYNIPLYINPAFSGTAKCSRAIVNYRNQWSNLPGNFNTIAASFDHNFAEYNSGVGILLTADQAGRANLRSTTAALQYAYQVDINENWSARAGLQAAFVNRSINFKDLTFGDQLSDDGPTGGPTRDIFSGTEQINYPDFSSGMMLYDENLWLGFAAHHLSRPNQSFQSSGGDSRLPIRYSIHSGYKIMLNQNQVRNQPGPRNPNYGRQTREVSISPTFLYKAQGKFDQLDVGLYYQYEPVLVGLWYRGLHPVKQYAPAYNNHDALIVQAGYQYESFSFGYSYDLTVSDLEPTSGGSHELSLSYLVCFEAYPKKKKPNYKLPCPIFYEERGLEKISHE